MSRLNDMRRFQNRMAKRTFKHGNWRQTVINCGGMCITKMDDGLPCGAVDGLEFHEPFGEDHIGWGIFQSRVLLCYLHHNDEHERLGFRHNGHGAPDECIKPSRLMADVDIEMMMCGGYDRWLKKFKLQDTFGLFLFY